MEGIKEMLKIQKLEGIKEKTSLQVVGELVCYTGIFVVARISNCLC